MFMRRGGATIFGELIAQRAARGGLSAARCRKELVSPSATPIGMRATRELALQAVTMPRRPQIALPPPWPVVPRRLASGAMEFLL